MLKRWDWILVIFIVLVILWRVQDHRSTDDTDPGPTAAPSVHKQPAREAKRPALKPAKPEVTPTPPANAIQAVTPQPLAAADSQSPRQPPKGMIEFEVKENGLAVAFGDIVLGKVSGDAKIARGMTAAQRSKLWPSAEIPFAIDKGITDTSAITAAIEQYHAHTSIRFVPYTGQGDGVVFVPAGELCASYLGRVGGAQPIFVAAQCGTNEIMHEIMHALGFVHEHSRPDRDKFVEVLWPNIDPQYWAQFYVVPDDQVHDYVGSVFTFDPESIMLYDASAFAKIPGTLTLKSRGTADLKPSRGAFSRTDRERIFYLYAQ